MEQSCVATLHTEELVRLVARQFVLFLHLLFVVIEGFLAKNAMVGRFGQVLDDICVS